MDGWDCLKKLYWCALCGRYVDDRKKDNVVDWRPRVYSSQP